MKNITEIIKAFIPDNLNFEIIELIGGHINKTYRIDYKNGNSFILQKMNLNVLKKPELIMSNISKISGILKKTNDFIYPDFLTYGNQNFYCDGNDFWRCYKYIPETISFTCFDNTLQSFEMGKILSSFHTAVLAADVTDFKTTIDNFHNSAFFLRRVLQINFEMPKDLFEFYRFSLENAIVFSGKNIPVKVTHNDIKCSNILFSNHSCKAVAIIDFDTIMPGYFEFDFADAVRSGCTVKNHFSLLLFREFCAGYFQKCVMHDSEAYFLAITCITSELSARYFYDSISDENYFSKMSSSKKFERAVDLMNLCKEFIDNKALIISILNDYKFR